MKCLCLRADESLWDMFGWFLNCVYLPICVSVTVRTYFGFIDMRGRLR